MTRVHLVVIAFCVASIARAADPTEMSLGGQLAGIAADVRQALADNPLVRGKKIAVGEFNPVGRMVRKTNFGLEIKRRLLELLKDVLDEKAELTLAGSYHFAVSDGADNRGVEVFTIDANLLSDNGKTIAPFKREVNVTDDVAGALGVVAFIDPKAGFAERNQKLREAVKKPTFALVEGDRVAAPGAEQWTVRFLRIANVTGAPTPVKPIDRDGLPFVEVQLGDRYELELRNADPKTDVVGVPTVDGLDVANVFFEDKGADGRKLVCSGFHVPKAGGVYPVKGWLHTLRPMAPDTVFGFTLVEHGRGSASPLKQPGGIGVITVQFKEAVPPGMPLSRSTQAETDKGPPLQQNLKSVDLKVGSVLSTVSIRYNVPQGI